MAFDEGLAQRIREYFEGDVNVHERKMFGGLAFMVNGNMSVGIVENELMVRVGPEAYQESLALKHVREMDFTGRPMKGFVYVGYQAIESDKGLSEWVERGYRFASSLLPK